MRQRLPRVEELVVAVVAAAVVAVVGDGASVSRVVGADEDANGTGSVRMWKEEGKERKSGR